MEKQVDAVALLKAEAELDGQAKKYIRLIGQKTEYRLWIGIVIVFSISNLIIPYLMEIPIFSTVLGYIMEFADWGGNMVPCTYIPKALLNWQISAGQWYFGIALALLTLLPYVITFLVTNSKYKKTLCWFVSIWYVIDTAVFLWYAIFGFIDILAYNTSVGVLVLAVFWKVLDLLLRVVVFLYLFEEPYLHIKRKTEWNKMVKLSYKWYSIVNGEEEAKKQPRINAELFSLQRIIEVSKKLQEKTEIEKLYEAYKKQL